MASACHVCADVLVHVARSGRLDADLDERSFLCRFYFQIIAYDRRRGGTIVIDKRETETVTSLLISQADETDSGRYTCDPASSYPQSIVVHVTKGKQQTTILIFVLSTEPLKVQSTIYMS